MGKVIPFKDNDVMKNYKKISASIDDFCEKFFSNNFKFFCLEMLKEIVALKSTLILKENSNKWSSAIIYSALCTKIDTGNKYLSLDDLSIYFEIIPEHIYEGKKEIEKLLELEKIKINTLYDKANCENQVFLSSLGNNLKEVLFDRDNNNNNYLEEELSLYIEEFYESAIFENLSNQEKEYADIIIETFDFTMINYIGENFSKWTSNGVKKCLKDILPKNFYIGSKMLISMVPVLKYFFEFLEEKSYINNGEELSNLVDKI